MSAALKVVAVESTVRTVCVCRADADRCLFEKDGRLIVRCFGCGLIRTGAKAADYASWYADGFYNVARESQKRYEARLVHDVGVALHRVSRLRELVSPEWPPRSVLDVGCANGAFLGQLAEEGCPRCVGLEPNRALAGFVRLVTECETATAREEITEAFELVTYHDVIEHVEDPVDELRWARDRCAGLLVVDTPDADDPRFGPDWHHAKPREHLWFFTEATLSKLLIDEGFSIAAVDRPIPGKLVIYARPA